MWSKREPSAEAIAMPEAPKGWFFRIGPKEGRVYYGTDVTKCFGVSMRQVGGGIFSEVYRSGPVYDADFKALAQEAAYLIETRDQDIAFESRKKTSVGDYPPKKWIGKE